MDLGIKCETGTNTCYGCSNNIALITCMVVQIPVDIKIILKDIKSIIKRGRYVRFSEGPCFDFKFYGDHPIVRLPTHNKLNGNYVMDIHPICFTYTERLLKTIDHGLASRGIGFISYIEYGLDNGKFKDIRNLTHCGNCNKLPWCNPKFDSMDWKRRW